MILIQKYLGKYNVCGFPIGSGGRRARTRWGCGVVDIELCKHRFLSLARSKRARPVLVLVLTKPTTAVGRRRGWRNVATCRRQLLLAFALSSHPLCYRTCTYCTGVLRLRCGTGRWHQTCIPACGLFAFAFSPCPLRHRTRIGELNRGVGSGAGVVESGWLVEG